MDGSLRQELTDARDALDLLLRDEAAIATLDTVAGAIAGALEAGAKVLAIGNGGSACDAAHFCEELTGRFRDDREPLAAIACTDAGYLTCAANDYGYDEVFSRWVRALGRPGDVLIAMSTSGNSENVVRAVSAACERELTVVTLLGKGGGRLLDAGTHQWIVPGDTADRIQELHMLLLHTLILGIERSLASRSRP